MTQTLAAAPRKRASGAAAAVAQRLTELVTVTNSIISNVQGQAEVNAAVTRRLLEHGEQLKQFEKRLQTLGCAGTLGRPTPVYLGDDLVLTRVLGRFKMFLDGRDLGPSCSLILDGYYQEAITETLESLLNPGMNVVDIGSGSGYFCLVAAGRVRPSGRVHAFEPDKRAFGLLEQNIALNEFGQEGSGTIDPHAVDPGEGKLEPHVPGKVDVARISTEYVTPRVFESLLDFRDKSPALTVLADWQPRRLHGANRSPASFFRQIEKMGFAPAPVRAPGQAIRIDGESAVDPEESGPLLLRLA